jgi:hypothetical protein
LLVVVKLYSYSTISYLKNGNARPRFPFGYFGLSSTITGDY